MSVKYRIIPIGGGGGITPTGTLDIRSEGIFDVTDYASVDVDIFDDTATKTITNNGTYNASDDHVIGYSQVTVEVPASAVDSGTLTIEPITQNVNLFTQDVTGYRAIAFEVAVPASAVDSGTKQITSNGNGQDVVGYASVDVNVPNGTETIQITQNGTYEPTSPNIGFSSVEVNVGGQTEPDYFSATGMQNGSMVSLRKNHQSSASLPVVYKSSDKINWTLWDGSPITLQNDETVYFYGNNPEGFSKNSTDYFSFCVGYNNDLKPVRFAGNIMTLLTKDGEQQFIPQYSFYKLFGYINADSYIAYPSDLGMKYFGDIAIGAKALYGYACADMFNGCVNLTNAPTLYGIILSDSCYYQMFYGCTALTQAPALPATKLATSCYDGMFYGCSSLTQAPSLNATILENSCYRSMFQNCTALTQAPALPATRMAYNCYNIMFAGCTALTQAPALPATTLAQNCYQAMFQGCTSLTTSPALNATGLASSCYDSMFYGCTALTQAPALPATALAQSCYLAMFQGCTSLTTAPALPATSAYYRSYYMMFYGCSSLNRVEISLSSWTNGAFGDWLYGVAATGDFYNLGGATIPTGTNGIPTGWTEHTTL